MPRLRGLVLLAWIFCAVTSVTALYHVDSILVRTARPGEQYAGQTTEAAVVITTLAIVALFNPCAAAFPQKLIREFAFIQKVLYLHYDGNTL